MRSWRAPSRVQTPATRPKSVALASAHRLVLVVERHRGQHRAEHFLLRQLVVRAARREQRRRLVEAAGRRVVDDRALRAPSGCRRAARRTGSPRRAAAASAGSAGRRRGPSRPGRRAAPRSARPGARARLVDRCARPAARLPAEQVWPAFCTMALTSTGIAASRSASAKTICGLLPPSSSVTGQCALGRDLLDQRADRGRPVKLMWSMPGCARQRVADLVAVAGHDVDRARRKAGLGASCATRSSDRQASSAGLTTQALPAPARRRRGGRRSASGSSTG